MSQNARQSRVLGRYLLTKALFYQQRAPKCSERLATLGYSCKFALVQTIFLFNLKTN